jgi:hypothetical protein
MVRVVNVRGMQTPEQRAGVVYVGRTFAGWAGHPLGNPFRPRFLHQIVTCLDKYRNWLLARPLIEADLAALWEQTGHGAKPLGCWCVNAVAGDGQPVICHAQVLAEMLRERFASKDDETAEWTPPAELGGES